MEKYLVPSETLPEKSKPKSKAARHPWKRSMVELNGRLEPSYRHELWGLLMNSYSEIGAFPHFYHADGKPCTTHMLRLADGESSRNYGHGFEALFERRARFQRGISSLEFDAKGVYLVSVTRSGCLTVHDFETLYCQSYNSSSSDGSGLKEDESKHVLHLSSPQQLDIVKWNPANQDEVVCASLKSNEVPIFDIGYISSKPVDVLRTRRTLSIFGADVHKGVCDIAFTIGNNSRIIGCDTYGVLNVWDRRTGALPCMELETEDSTTINSIQISADNQTLFGADQHGVIYVWDLRGGRTSAAFQSHKEVRGMPLTSFHLAPMMRKIKFLKAQAEIVPKAIHSINFNPSCPYQLAFHFEDGWSGVLDTYSSEITHVHCPPPVWLDGSDGVDMLLHSRKPSWLPTSSIYVVRSISENGIHLLDFYPSSSSPTHVDYDDDLKNTTELKRQIKRNVFVPLSEGITACTAHPLNNTVIAGTKKSSLLVVSQRYQASNQEPDKEDKPSQPTV